MTNNPRFTLVALAPDRCLPRRQHETDAGYDLRVWQHTINAWGVDVICTGVKVSIPPGYVGLIRERSSWAMRGLVIVGGVIDSGYTGEIKVFCHGYKDALLSSEDGRLPRFAQIIIVPVLAEGAALRSDLRGDGGFGSTDKGQS